MAVNSTEVSSVGRLTSGQSSAIEICTRTMSVLSLLGSSYIICTFIAFPFYRKPIHRLVFYATWGNILANVGSLISISAFPQGHQKPGTLCQFQAFLIQWFMLADSLWVFSMATNVFLVFWRGYDSVQLCHLEKWYFLFAYGLPGVLPIVYIILDRYRQVPILGPATLWCWVAKEADWMRLAFFYGPVWIAVSATLTIYIATGIKIFRKGALLRNFANESHQKSQNQDPAAAEETTANPFGAGKNIIVTTEIQHDVHDHSVDSLRGSYDDDVTSLTSYSSTNNLSTARPREEAGATVDQGRPSRFSYDMKSSTDTQKTLHQHNEGANRGYRATVSATSQCGEPTTLPPKSSPATARPRGSRLKRAVGNEAALAYLKVAFLMFVALIVVWVPSSVNRLYQFIHGNQPSFPLSLLSATVLPMQGAWNATIYIYTTRAECGRAYAILQSKILGKTITYHPRRHKDQKDNLISSQGTKDYDVEIQLEEGLEQGDSLRHCKLARPDSIVDSKPDRL